MKKHYFWWAKLFVIVSLCSLPFVGLPNPQSLQTVTQNFTSASTQALNSASITYTGGRALCNGPYAIWVNCDFSETKVVPNTTFVFKNPNYLYQQLIASIFNLPNSNEIKSISYDNTARTLVFESPTYFYQECEITDNPQNLPGMPELPKRHNHYKLLGVKVKNTQNQNSFAARAYSRDTQIKVQFDQAITNWAISVDDINFQNLLKMDENKIFRGFKTNYFGLSVNNEYIKALIIKNINEVWIAAALSNSEYTALFQTKNFETLIKLMKSGTLLDFENDYIKQIVDEEILTNQQYNVRCWMSKLLNSESESEINNVQPTKYTEWIKIYELENLINQNMQLITMLFNKTFKFAISWFTSNNEQINTTMFTLEFSAPSKSFKLLLPNKQQMLIAIPDLTNSTAIIISDLKLINSSDMASENFTIPLLDLNNKWLSFDTEKYYSNPSFDVRKLVTANSFESVYQWISLLDLNKYEDVTDTCIPMIIEKPEFLIKNSAYLKSILQFNNETSMINVYEQKLKNLLLASKDTLVDNTQLNHLIASWTVKAYNSKNQIVFDFNFKDLNANNNLISDRTLLKQIVFDLTPYQVCEDSDTTLINPIVRLDNAKDSSLITKLILDEYIKYNDQTDANDFIAATSLNKQDWIDNAFIDLEIINKTTNLWSCNLKFKEKIYKNLPKTQIESTISFKLEFNESNPAVINPPTTELENIQDNGFKQWIMWGGIIGAALLVIMLIAIYIYTKKTKQSS